MSDFLPEKPKESLVPDWRVDQHTRFVYNQPGLLCRSNSRSDIVQRSGVSARQQIQIP